MVRLRRITWLVLVVAGVVSPLAPGAEPPSPTVETLKAEVYILKRESELAEAKLGWARARLAKAEGKRDVAAAEGRKVVAYFESMWQEITKGRGCCVEAEVRAVQRSLLEARVLVAEVEGRDDVLRAELPRLAEYHEWRMRHYRELLMRKDVVEKVGQDAIDDSRAELRRTNDRLAGLRAKPTGQAKPADDEIRKSPLQRNSS
jgi:hypothetical protein